MFGARLEQLPEIWKRLVDAGFESGHAYGKSLRTVKSCVGSTWCRYGVQDSVGMAVQLELRYRGLRSPHKIKLGVSGCARECAEARGKDVGVIATEAGWNMYVGGNGGFTPRHAVLFAEGLDDAALLQAIDRFLMYYVRTADRLQRTAPWFEEMEGGVDALRAVIFEDSLGIAADLDAAMARTSTPTRTSGRRPSRTPRSCAGSPRSSTRPTTPDPSLAYTSERGQPRPATSDERDDPRVLDRGHDAGGAAMTALQNLTATAARPQESPTDPPRRPLAVWVRVCTVADLERERGLAALIDGEQIALFRTHDDRIHAVQQLDPYSGAYVMSRGIVGTQGDAPTVASPMYKQVFDLRTGACLETQGKDEHSLRVWPVAVDASGDVFIKWKAPS